jgi:uncharacterized protein
MRRAAGTDAARGKTGQRAPRTPQNATRFPPALYSPAFGPRDESIRCRDSRWKRAPIFLFLPAVSIHLLVTAVSVDDRLQGRRMADRNIETVQDIYAAFGRGDVAGIMAHLSDDLRGFGVVSEQKLVPWHMEITRKQDVPHFFQAIAESSDFTRFEPRDFAAAGNQVYCTVSFDVTFKRNGKKVTHDNVMHRFTFKDGKVIEWRGTEDTAKTGAAYAAAG